MKLCKENEQFFIVAFLIIFNLSFLYLNDRQTLVTNFLAQENSGFLNILFKKKLI